MSQLAGRALKGSPEQRTAPPRSFVHMFPHNYVAVKVPRRATTRARQPLTCKSSDPFCCFVASNPRRLAVHLLPKGPTTALNDVSLLAARAFAQPTRRCNERHLLQCAESSMSCTLTMRHMAETALSSLHVKPRDQTLSALIYC